MTEQPGIRGLRIGLPARQWRLRDACGLSRLNDLLALWSQAHMPSCNRQVTWTSIRMAEPGPASAPRGHAPLQTGTLSLARTISDRRIFAGDSACAGIAVGAQINHSGVLLGTHPVPKAVTSPVRVWGAVWNTWVGVDSR